MKIYIVLIAAVAMLNSCRKVKTPRFEEIEKIKIVKPGFDNTEVEAHLKFFNANPYSFELTAVRCSLFVENKWLGNFETSSAQKINAEKAFLLAVNGEVNTAALLKLGTAALTKDDFLVTARGKASVKKMLFQKQIAINVTDTISLSSLKLW